MHLSTLTNVPSLELPSSLTASRSVVLRPFSLDDVPAVTGACQDREISRWTASVPWPYREEDATGWISSQPTSLADGRALAFAITLQNTKEFAGAISLGEFDWDFRTAQAGYWVAAPARGRGVATAALRAITDWGFERLNLSMVTLITLVGNVASERVAENARFDMVGELTDYRHPHSPEVSLHVKTWALYAP